MELTVSSPSPLPRADVARLLMQALADYGFPKAAAALEAESGAHLELPAATELSSAVLAGEWERVLALLVPPSPLALPRDARALVLEQVFLEEAAHAPLAALVTLRTRLAPLLAPAHLHRLAALLAAPDAATLARLARWAPPPASRQALLSRLRALMPPGAVLPPRRLDALAQQAALWQRQACAYHQGGGGAAASLLADHVCRPLVLPRAPAAALEAHADEVWCVAFARTHASLACGARDGAVAVWRWAERGAAARKLLGHSQAVSALAWSPADALLASGSLDGTVRVWRAEEGECVATLAGHSDGVVALAWLPDGRHLVSTAHDRLVLVWDVPGQRVAQRVPCRVRLHDLAVAPGGEQLVAVCQERRIRFFPVPPTPGAAWAGEDEARALQESEALTSAALSADGKWLLVTTAGTGPAVHLWSLERRALVHKFTGHKQGRFVVRACFGGADESLVLSGSEDSLVYVWQRTTGSLLAALAGHAGTVNAVAAAPGAELVFASASDDHTLLLWRAE